MLNSAMDAYIRCDSFVKAVSLFQSVHPSAKQYMDQWKGAWTVQATTSMTKKIRLLFEEASLKLTIRTFNVLLKGLRSLGSDAYSFSRDVVADMQRSHIEADTVTLNTLVDIRALGGDLGASEKVTISIL
jgi:hypothetical protein